MFDQAFELLMINEGGNRPDGGLVTDPYDSGGTTKYGISQSAFPDVKVAELTIEAARDLYFNNYWTLFKCDKLPWAIAWTLFDCVVNHSAHEAIGWLQAAVGVAVDGIMGPKTIAAAIKAAEPLDVARDMTLARRDYVETLHNFDRFKAGWVKRQLDTLIAAVQWEPQETQAPQKQE